MEQIQEEEIAQLSVSHYCLKDKQKVVLIVDDIYTSEKGRRYAVGNCPLCGNEQKRAVKQEVVDAFRLQEELKGEETVDE